MEQKGHSKDGDPDLCYVTLGEGIQRWAANGWLLSKHHFTLLDAPYRLHPGRSTAVCQVKTWELQHPSVLHASLLTLFAGACVFVRETSYELKK